MSSSITAKKSRHSIDLVFSGEISEASNFPELDLNNVENVNLNTEGVTYINSSGLRKWLIWISEFENSFPHQQLNLQRVKPVLVNQMRNIATFVPQKTKIESIYLPFYCEACDRSEEKFASCGSEFGKHVSQSDLMNLINQSPCSVCKKQMIFDGDNVFYLSLLINKNGSK